MRLKIVGIALAIALLFVALLAFMLPAKGVAGRLLIDSASPLFPFTVQAVMWLVFAVGLGEIFVRFRVAQSERAQLSAGLLPEDEETLLENEDLGAIYSRATKLDAEAFLPRLVKRIVLQVQTTGSLEQAMALLSSSLELFVHEIDLRYNMLRYIMWFIPTLGFIGTVIGIADALTYAGGFDEAQPIPMDELTARLGTAFYTTLLALLMAGVLVFLLQLVQAMEEKSLNESGQYCLDNLINRLLKEG